MIDDIYNKVATELNLEEKIVKEAYKSYWKTIRDMIQELPLKDNLSEEEFSKLRPNFNLGSLGKLCVTDRRYKGIKKRFEYIKQLREKNDKHKEN